jgi:hypothetical protein
MTVIADNKNCGPLLAKTGKRFGVKSVGSCKSILTRLAPIKPRKTKVTFKKVNGYTVGVLGHPIDEAALRKALGECPCD